MELSLIGISGTQFATLLSQCVLYVAPYTAILYLGGKVARLVIGAITGRGIRL